MLEYAAAAAAAQLAACLRDASGLFVGTTSSFLQPGAPPRGCPRFAQLHALELRVAKGMDKYFALVGQAAEERRMRVGSGDLLDMERCEAGSRFVVFVVFFRSQLVSIHRSAAAAGAAARSLFTGAVALLHSREAAPLADSAAALCALHGESLGAATACLDAALEAAAHLASQRGAEQSADAVRCVRDLEAAVAALADAAAASAAATAGQAAAEVSLAARRAATAAEAAACSAREAAAAAGAAGAAAAADTAAAHRALGSVVVGLGDAARACGRIVANLQPDAEGYAVLCVPASIEDSLLL